MLLPVTDIMKVLTRLKVEKDTMQHTISEQGMEISRLHYRPDSKNRAILRLKSEINSLRKQLSQYEEPTKDSHNSSIPPSQEPISLEQTPNKVSGCLRSDKGADIFTQLLSIADTSKKNGKSRFQALNLIAKEIRLGKIHPERKTENRNMLY